MIFNISYFDNLITLPAIRQHRAVSEKMHIDSLWIKTRISYQTKMTLHNFSLLIITIIARTTTSFSSFCCILFKFLPCWLVNDCFNNFIGHRNLLFWYFYWFSIINLLKASHKSIETCLTNPFKMNRNLISAHSLIQFTKTIISRCSNIMRCVLNTLNCVFHCDYLLLLIKLISLKQTSKYFIFSFLLFRCQWNFLCIRSFRFGGQWGIINKLIKNKFDTKLRV